MLTPAQIEYIINFQPTRAMSLGLLPYPDRVCRNCGGSHHESVDC